MTSFVSGTKMALVLRLRQAIVAAKGEIILLGVINQSLVELRHFSEMPTSASKVKEEPAMKRLKTNLEYLINIVVHLAWSSNFWTALRRLLKARLPSTMS